MPSSHRSRQPLARLCLGVLVRPRQTLATIAASSTVGQGFLMTCGLGGLYSLGAWLSYRRGRKPPGQTLTFIPPEQYYRWEALFMTPIAVAWMTQLTLLVRAGARRAGGHGTLQGDFTVLAFAHTMPIAALMWLPDMTCYLLRVDERRYAQLYRLYIPAATAWSIGLATLGTATAERISWKRALGILLPADLVSAVTSGVAVASR